MAKIGKSTGIFLLLFLFGVTAASARNGGEGKSPQRIVVPGERDSVFDKTVDYLQEHGYFIRRLDKEAGFVQAKVFVDHKKLLSVKAGERRTLNFIVRSDAPSDGRQRSKITLCIYREDYNRGGGDSHFYYYEDRGVSDDMSLYTPVLEGLRQAFRAQQTGLTE